MQQFIAAYSTGLAGTSQRTLLPPPDPATRPAKSDAKAKKKKPALFHPFHSKKKQKESLGKNVCPSVLQSRRTIGKISIFFKAQSPRGREEESDTSSMQGNEGNPFHDRQQSFDVAVGRHGRSWRFQLPAWALYDLTHLVTGPWKARRLRVHSMATIRLRRYIHNRFGSWDFCRLVVHPLLH